jgi:hypothetical protein
MKLGCLGVNDVSTIFVLLALPFVSALILLFVYYLFFTALHESENTNKLH